MKSVTVKMQDKYYNHFLALVSNLDYVKEVEEEYKPQTKKEIIYGLREAFDELKLIKAGKMEGRNAFELLKEL